MQSLIDTFTLLCICCNSIIPSLPSLPRSIFILPAVITVTFATLTFYPWSGQYMAGELSQRGTINQLFSNMTWVNLPNPSEIDDLPVGSNDYQLVRQWGNPNIWVSLILFIFVRVRCNIVLVNTGICHSNLH